MTTRPSRRFKDLYIDGDYVPPKEHLEKQAQHRLTPNISNWPIEILKIFGEDYGWVTEGVRPATVDLERVDKESGSGFGGIVVWSKPGGEPPKDASPFARAPNGKHPMAPAGSTVIIPFVIRNFMMSPLDVFVSGKKVQPLTPKRLQDELMANELFLGVDRSRQKPLDSLQAELAPPPETFYGHFGRPYGGGDGQGSRYASAISTQDSLILNQVISTLSPTEMKTFRETIFRSPATLAQFVRNKNVDILQRILKGRPLTKDDYSNVARWGFPKNIFVFEKLGPGRWAVCMRNDFYAAGDHMEASEQQLLEQFITFPGINERIWNSDGFIVTVNHKEVKPIVWHENLKPETEPVHSTGVWLVVTDNKQVERGFAWKGFRDYHGNAMDYILWYDGDCWSVQERMQGEKDIDQEWEHPEGTLKEGIWGTWLCANEEGELCPCMPFKIHAVYHNGGQVLIRATDLFGHDVSFIVDPCVQKFCSATGALSPALAGEIGANAFLVPASTRIVTLGDQRIRIVESEREIRNALRDVSIGQLALYRDKAHPATTVVVTHLHGAGPYGSAQAFRLEGNILQSAGRENPCETSRLHAKEALVTLGCSVEDADAILETAVANHRIIVMNMRPMKRETNVKIDAATDEIIKISRILRKHLVKEAAYIKEKGSVDALLSLNFITPENLIVFLENLDRFQEVEASLAKLLLMVRFGLEAVPEAAVNNALKNLNLVNESLEMLRGVLGKRLVPAKTEEEGASQTADTTLE